MNANSKFRLIAAGMAALAAFPAAGLAQGPYVGVSGGIALPGDSRNSGQFDATVPATEDFDAIPADTTLEWQTQFDTGYAING